VEKALKDFNHSLRLEKSHGDLVFILMNRARAITAAETATATEKVPLLAGAVPNSAGTTSCTVS